MNIVRNLALLSLIAAIAVQTAIASETQLNAYQVFYRDWTETNFEAMLNAEDYSDLSAGTRAELGEHWMKRLSSMLDDVNTGGGYTPDDAKKWQAINILAGLGHKPAVKPLITVAAENRAKDNRERWMAVRALGMLGDPAAAPSLVHLVYHYNFNTRVWAQIALAQLTGQNFGYDWRAWAEWWNESGNEPPCPLDKVDWALPPGADAAWGDPEYQKSKDMQHFAAKIEGFDPAAWK